MYMIEHDTSREDKVRITRQNTNHNASSTRIAYWSMNHVVRVGKNDLDGDGGWRIGRIGWGGGTEKRGGEHESWREDAWQCLGGRRGAATVVDYMSFFHFFFHGIFTCPTPSSAFTFPNFTYTHMWEHVCISIHLYTFPCISSDSSTYLHTCMHVHTHSHLNCSFKSFVLFGSNSNAHFLSLGFCHLLPPPTHFFLFIF